MGEFYGASWVRQYGENGGSGWETWVKALSQLSIEEITTGVEMLFSNLPKYPPNLPQFREMCHGDIEQAHGLKGKEMEFAPFMNFVCRAPKLGEEKDFSVLKPVMYWIYLNIDSFNWRKMQCKDARAHFNRVYAQALQLAKEGFEFPDVPAQIETEDIQKDRQHKANKNNPEYVSKNRAAGKAAFAEMRKIMSMPKGVA